MKFFYTLMLLLIATSSVIRFAGARRQSTQAMDTPTPESAPTGSGITPARVLVLQEEDSNTMSCEDLTITAVGNAVYSNCGHGIEKGYVLSGAERIKLNNWIGQFEPIDYSHEDNTQTNAMTVQLYFNGHGDKQASDTETRQVLNFAEDLVTKIALQP